MRRAVRVVALVACVALSATVGSSAAFDSRVFGIEEWQRALAELPLDPNDVVYPFHATPEMVEWAKVKLAPYMTNSPDVRLQALQKAFFESNEFEFEYEQSRTLTAEEAFAARNGNCMSF
ncbi:MAG: hypothetical protein MUP13_02805, partial [Thermoanaerobaculales bacterium]|nr:hypothetical protein [Thermoanaerobaculales bacterium]